MAHILVMFCFSLAANSVDMIRCLNTCQSLCLVILREFVSQKVTSGQDGLRPCVMIQKAICCKDSTASVCAVVKLQC